METYALESYNPDLGYRRHFLGTKEEMVKKLGDVIDDSLSSGDFDSYFRIDKVSEQDREDWKAQEDNLPEIDPTRRLFGEWVQMSVAAKYLNVTFGRVFNLVTSEDIRCTSSGRNKLVNVHDVVQRKITNPKAGRPSKQSVYGADKDK